jgi:7-cyano-7-deazaguanine synthase
MCALVGMIGNDQPVLQHILAASYARGRDGFGFYERDGLYIANFRAEPTTEYVKDKQVYDQQPYRLGDWSIVHNGTIANDKDIRTNLHASRIDSAAIVEVLNDSEDFQSGIERLRGSYAIIGIWEHDPDALYVAVNYQALWWARSPNGTTFIASSREFFPDHMFPKPIEPYSSWLFTSTEPVRLSPVRQLTEPRRALVVASGGLDSTVAACAMIAGGYDVELLHFRYGSRAEGPEVRAIKAIAEHLQVPYHLFPLPIYRPGDSPLLNADSPIAGGEAGAEQAFEWVPARNLVMLSIATALAEARGIETIALGNNIEEAGGGFADNTQEFIAKFNDILPFSIGVDKRVRVLEPVGNLTKREIVALGHKLGAPIHLTWSCYRAGNTHCGTCGPCHMRFLAHQHLGLVDPVFLEDA